MKKSWKKRVGIALLLSASLLLAALPVAAEDAPPAVAIEDDYLVEEGAGDEALVDMEGDEALVDMEGDDVFLGETTSELVFYPLTPCRIVDTRIASRWGFSPIPSGAQISLDVYGNTSSQGGAASCGVSSDAGGVVINVTAIPQGSLGNGYLTVWPFGLGMPLASLVNYNGANAGAFANSVVQTIRYGGADQLSVYASKRAHVVIDVIGYFRRPSDTVLESTQPSNSRSLAAGGGYGSVSVSCPSGYGLTGGGCSMGHYTHTMAIVVSRPSSNSWNCQGINEHPSQNTTMTAYAVCARTPGW